MTGATARVRLNAIFLAIVTCILCTCSGSSRAEKDCTSEFTSLGTCLAFVTGQDASPPPDCCNALTNIYKNDPVCLCQLAEPGGPSDVLPGFNVTLAAELPALCSIPDAANACGPAAPPASPPSSSAQLVSISGAFNLLFTIAAMMCTLWLH